jgi:hypothetical protein
MALGLEHSDLISLGVSRPEDILILNCDAVAHPPPLGLVERSKPKRLSAAELFKKCVRRPRGLTDKPTKSRERGTGRSL